MDCKPFGAITASSDFSTDLAPIILQNEASAEALAVNQDNPIITDKDGNRKYFLEFDVRQFKPDELNVRTENNVLSVHAVHEYKEGGKEEYREFARQYTLPADLKDENLESTLSPDGVLTITAPLPSIKPAIESSQTSSLKQIVHIDRR